MRITVTEVVPYNGQGLGHAVGIEYETDRVVKFRADWRQLEHLRRDLESAHDVDYEIEEWQVERASPSPHPRGACRGRFLS